MNLEHIPEIPIKDNEYRFFMKYPIMEKIYNAEQKLSQDGSEHSLSQ